jgi:hypothetical protein
MTSQAPTSGKQKAADCEGHRQPQPRARGNERSRQPSRFAQILSAHLPVVVVQDVLSDQMPISDASSVNQYDRGL